MNLIISNKPIDSFNDFGQREYDFDDLEKKLLDWDTEENCDIDPKEKLKDFLVSLQENQII